MDEDGTPCICTSEHFRLLTWINNAVKCKVEALNLKMILYDDEEAPFPSRVFLCGSLKSLVVDMNFTLMRTPSAFSSNLNRLVLKHVVIEDEGFFKWISSSCKFLQELNLDNFYGTQSITIENSSLKRVQFTGVNNTSHLNISGEKLEQITIAWFFESPSDKSLSISAPNLKLFTWEGSLAGRTTLGKFQSIKCATLFLKPEADALDNVYGVLSSVCKANVLMLDESTFKAPFGEVSMPAPIYDTLCMGMIVRILQSFTDDLIPAMASLFKGYPKLKFLFIYSSQPQDDSQHNTSGFNVEYWKLQNLALIHQLREVRLELHNESNGIYLARYILECAPSLLKMDIICPTANLEEVRGTLLKSKKVSSATVVFSEK